jgi:hypothetical protein
MNSAKKFLEDLQGLILFLRKKNGLIPPLKNLMEMPINNPKLFREIFEEYNEKHETELQDFFKSQEKKIEQTYKMSLVEVYQKFEVFNKGGTEKDLDKGLKEMKEYYSDLVLNLPTKYQELSSYGTVKGLLDDILNASNLLGYEIPVKPIIGTVSTNSVNAVAFTLENGEPIIIVQDDFLSFIHLFAKIFVQCLSLKDEWTIIFSREEILKNVKEKPEILHRFKDFLNGYIDGSPRNSEQYFLPKDSRYILCTYLIRSAELFMIGHEVGHIIKHQKERKLKFWCFNEEYSSSYEDSLRLEKEFEADKLGLQLSIQAMKKDNFLMDFCFVGIECFFIINDIALKAKQILSDGTEDISSNFKSYPTNSLRRDRIREELKAITSNEELLNALCLPDVIDETISYLWENSKEVFYQEYIKRNKHN